MVPVPGHSGGIIRVAGISFHFNRALPLEIIIGLVIFGVEAVIEVAREAE